MKVAIVGLGYVGLPLAVLCARKGFEVAGIDINEEIVGLTNEGVSHIDDEQLKKSLAKVKGKLTATTDFSVIKDAGYIVVCVPTPVDDKKQPNLLPLKSALEAIAKHLSEGQVVIIESTIYPGVTEEIGIPVLEGSGLKAGKDFHVAHCPERIDPGNEEWPLEKIPRVLGALTEEGAECAKEFYSKILEKEPMVLSSLKAAEAVKVTENTFRDVNIAFVNELAQSFDLLGIDIKEVVDAASTKPFGFMPFYPGPGVGGHCIPVDPYYLIKKAKESGFSHRFLELAREINDGMPNYVEKLTLDMLKRAGKQGGKAVVLGLAYKRNVDDLRESPATKILSLLEKSANAKAFDPFVPGKSDFKSLDEAVEYADVLVLATDHDGIVAVLSPNSLKGRIAGIVDARNRLNRKDFEDAGLLYKGLGK